MALVLVMLVVAFVSALAYAMLANNSLQAQVSENLVRSASAECAAESGVSLAMYYLRYPEKAPAGSLNADGYWPGQNAVSFGDGTQAGVAAALVAGTFDTYDVTATGKASATSQLQRVRTVRMQVGSGFNVKQAAVINGGVELENMWKVDGDLATNGTLTIDPGGSVKGTAIARAIVNAGGSSALGKGLILAANQTVYVPAVGDVRDYATYTYNGVTYAAMKLLPGTYHDGPKPPGGGPVTWQYDPGPPPPIGSPPKPVTLDHLTTFVPTPTNPAGVYYADGDVTLNQEVGLSGTLVVRGTFNLRGDKNVLTAQAGFPALLVMQDLNIERKGWSLTVNGLVYLGLGITVDKTDSQKSNLTITGAYVSPAAVPVDPDHNGGLTIKYDPMANITDLLKVQRLDGVRVVSWK